MASLLVLGSLISPILRFEWPGLLAPDAIKHFMKYHMVPWYCAAAVHHYRVRSNSSCKGLINWDSLGNLCVLLLLACDKSAKRLMNKTGDPPPTVVKFPVELVNLGNTPLSALFSFRLTISRVGNNGTLIRLRSV